MGRDLRRYQRGWQLAVHHYRLHQTTVIPIQRWSQSFTVNMDLNQLNGPYLNNDMTNVKERKGFGYVYESPQPMPCHDFVYVMPSKKEMLKCVQKWVSLSTWNLKRIRHQTKTSLPGTEFAAHLYKDVCRTVRVDCFLIRAKERAKRQHVKLPVDIKYRYFREQCTSMYRGAWWFKIMIRHYKYTIPAFHCYISELQYWGMA